MNLQKNMGTADRIIRPALAAAAMTASATGRVKRKTAIALLCLSAIFIATSSVGWCPAYQAAGISTI